MSSIVDPPDGLLPPWTLEQVKRWEEREAATRGRGEAQAMHDINSGARCITDVNAAKVGAWGLGFGPHKSTISDADALGREDTAGGPRYDDEPKRILQAPGWVAFLGEEAGDYVYIPLDGRPTPGPNVRQWNGVPRGHWEGNTLVVEITNVYFDYPIIPNGGFQAYPGDGKTLKVIKRFARTGPDTLQYRFTIEDPAVYTRPYTVLHDLFRDDHYKTSPDMCHENNGRNMGNVLTNARADEATATENGYASARIRKPRLEEIKKRAQDASQEAGAKNGGSKSR